MFRPLQLFIGLRYTRAKRRNRFISFISFSSMLGIALGITALITVLSVMNGFESEMRERILGMASHATISGLDGRLNNWQAAAVVAHKTPEVRGVAPYIQAEGMLAAGDRVSGALIRGIDPKLEPQVSVIGKKLQVGRLDLLRPGEFGILLGRELAWSLGVRVGDRVTLITPEANVTPAGMLPRLKRFTVVGIFSIGMYDYDRGMAFIDIDDAARLFRYGKAVTGLRLRLDDLFQAPRVARELAARLPGEYRVRDWTQDHANYFRAVSTEKTAMFIILLLIVAVAAFNIVATLVMVVTDKRSDIAILRTLGASPRFIMGVFVVQGTVIGFVGTVIGTIGGILLALNVPVIVPWIEHTFHVHFLPADLYYISELPSQLRMHDVVRISSVAFVLSVLATIYPAWRASRTQPAEALRYE